MHKPEIESSSTPLMARLHCPVWLTMALLILVTVILYWPAVRHGFVNYDDNFYVTANVHIQYGLTGENLKWAFFNPVDNNWHPLTVLSHMLDCQLFGLNPWGHHLINVLLHALNTGLVFFLLRQLTGATWRSLMVAALFGWHPVHVESVAWVAERKDVLSTCFGLLSLIFYVRFAEQKGARSQQQGTSISLILVPYFWSLFFFALGLMSKAMLVTWPFVMLLLDYWPLERFKVQGSRFKVQRLILEKVPFLGLSVLMSVVTFVVQKRTVAVVSVENLPLGARGENALISYCRYLGKLFWPTDLAVFYPYAGAWPMAEVLLAGGLLLGITALCVVIRRHRPFLLVGWLWYIGTLVPVIGLVQVGEQSMADRYTYIPSLGVLILLIWGMYELTCRWRHQLLVLSVPASAAIVLCLGLTRQQLGYWKDSETLFRHALEVTKNNYLAHNNLGFTLLEKGQVDEAISQFQEAIRLNPDDAIANINLGIALHRKGQIDETIRQFREAIRLKPDFAEAYFNLGSALAEKNQIDEAISQFQEAIRFKPDYPDAHYNLGTTLLGKNRVDEAIDQFQAATRLKPDYAEAHNNLGIALYQKGQLDEATRQFQEAIRWKPDFAAARSNLARVLGQKNAPANQ
jgi:tetratricopeptide (TPR) repeat protein